jgi:CDP-6-deoxy-D-xylo-4-hexulose-3-dehydrase
MNTIQNLAWPLMKNNLAKEDFARVVELLHQQDPILTQSDHVNEFEKEWSAWLGVKYSVFVNSGSSANLLTMCALKERYGSGEIIVPPLTWVSDIASVIQSGFKPVFVDIDRRTLGMDNQQMLERISPDTRAVFMTHVLGFNALKKSALAELDRRSIPLIEDVCESHGATCEGQKLGTFGLMSNFSFYYAHHMSTIEGGMICTNDSDLYEILRMLRSHGMVRESFPAYNVRSTEINAVIGRSQLKRLDANNRIRSENLDLFLDHLDSEKYQTDFVTAGSCNYAFTLVLNRADPVLCENVMQMMRRYNVEFRRGTSGGGNQLRQPYLRRIMGEREFEKYPNVDHVHFYGFYIGNYPDLEREKILELCSLLNSVSGEEARYVS